MLIEKLIGIHLRVHGDRLMVETDAPLTNEQRTFIKKHKAQLLDETKLHALLEICCEGLDTHPRAVIDRLLSPVNQFDIIAGDIPIQTVRAHILLWIDEGKQKINEVKLPDQ